MRYHSYGKLFHHRADITGEWVQGLIQRISALSCEFHVESDNHINGINVSLRKKSVVDTDDILGEEIAEFMVCSYVIKNKKKVCKDSEETMTFHPHVNIVLDTLNNDYVTIINKEAIESINTILNHPHFKGCNSLEDVQGAIQSVEELGGRFGITSSEEEGMGEGGKYEVMEQKNIFLD